MYPSPQKISRIITFDVIIPATTAQGSNIMFPDVPQIRDKKICALISYTSTSAIAQGITGATVITEAQGRNLYVSLKDRDTNQVFVNEIPVLYFDAIGFQQAVRYFDPARVLSIESCFLTATAGGFEGESATFSVIYE